MRVIVAVEPVDVGWLKTHGAIIYRQRQGKELSHGKARECAFVYVAIQIDAVTTETSVRLIH